MVLVGLLLIAAAAGFTIDVFVENTADIDVDVLGRTFVVNSGWLVVAGIVAVAAFLIGARLVVVGVARARRRRVALRAARLASQERDQLAQQLVAERAERSTAHSPQVPLDHSRANTAPAESPGNNASASP